ncbi:hypothetical protein BAE46_09500 [Glaciecola punicea]|uniref:hypothetical protein n=1 Tax=Glaciecola punicea TaxID=56804 RepID=UPI0008732B58|nr:hypothetical protein [Glaciecola punicea]OFA30885.1 hypothetical protein BAE46_09500 [Glaciecola punicea]
MLEFATAQSASGRQLIPNASDVIDVDVSIDAAIKTDAATKPDANIGEYFYAKTVLSASA